MHVHEGEKFVERPYKVELCTVPVNGHFWGYPSDLLLVRNKQSEDYLNLYPKKMLEVRNLHIILTGRIDAIVSDSNCL